MSKKKLSTLLSIQVELDDGCYSCALGDHALVHGPNDRMGHERRCRAGAEEEFIPWGESIHKPAPDDCPLRTHAYIRIEKTKGG